MLNLTTLKLDSKINHKTKNQFEVNFNLKKKEKKFDRFKFGCKLKADRE